MADNDKSFDQIMREITAGLTHDSKHDVRYLTDAVAEYADHPMATEIARACGRLLWDEAPEGGRAGLVTDAADDAAGYDAVLRETNFNLKSGNPQRALELIAPLAAKVDDLVAGGWGAEDAQSVTFDFLSVVDEAIWRAHSGDEREVRISPWPLSDVYYALGTCLFELGRHEEAIAALDKAIRWNPSQAVIRHERGENFKALGDMESYGACVDECHSWVRNAPEMARFLRSKGYWCVEGGEFELAAACFVFSFVYEYAPSAAAELLYLKTSFGVDYTDMEPPEASAILYEHGVPQYANPDTVDAMAQLLDPVLEAGDAATAIELAENLQGLTGDEGFGKLADQLRAHGAAPSRE